MNQIRGNMCAQYQRTVSDDVHNYSDIIQILEQYAIDEGLEISDIVLTKKPVFATEQNKQKACYESPLLSDFEYVNQYRNGGYTGDDFEGYVAVKASDSEIYFMYWYQC